MKNKNEEKKYKKIKINDKRPRNILITVIITIIILIISIFVFRRIINTKLSKEIVTDDIVPHKEIEWLSEEYEGILNLEDIIQENITKETKVIIETQIVELEYETEYINNSSLPMGNLKISREGEDGKQELIIKKEYKGETLIVDEQIGRRVVTPTINKIIEIGTGSFFDIIENSNNDKEYSKQELLNKVSKNMALNKPSGLTLEQFKKMFEGESKDKNGVFAENAEYFYYVEKVYGVNGVCVAAIGIHESAWGTSKIATDKKNLFGYGAYDMSAYASAYKYNGYAAGIDMIARVLMKNYLNTKGTVLCNGEIASGKYYNGNTLSGVNKKYATDKKWADGVNSWMRYLYNRL